MKYIEQAWSNNSEKNDTIRVAKITPEVVGDIVQKEITEFETWIENRNSIIYKFKADDKYLVGKLSKHMTPAEVVNELTTFKELSSIKSSELLIPQVYGHREDLRIYVMDLISGKTLSSMVGENKSKGQLLESCKLVGKILSTIHSEWSEKVNEHKTLEIIDDIKRMPGGISKKENKKLQKAYEFLKNDPLPVGKIYKDFDPINIFYKQGTLALIDPPENNIYGVLYWDLATFFIGLRKAILKKKLFISRTDSEFLDQCKHVVLHEYQKGSTIQTLPKKKFDLIIALLELQRIGELLVFQKKHTRKNHVLSVKGLYNRVALKLLHTEKKKVIALIGKILSHQ